MPSKPPPSTVPVPPPPAAHCTACGQCAPVALLAYPGDAPPPIALCARCARDRDHVRALIRACGARAVTVLAASPRRDTP